MEGGSSHYCSAMAPSGSYILIIVSQPVTEHDKDVILERLSKGLLSWDVESTGCDLSGLETVCSSISSKHLDDTDVLIQYSTESLGVEVLVNPTVSTLKQCVKNFLSTSTGHKHLIHTGYTFAGSGSWILQNGTFSYDDFLEIFQQADVQSQKRCNIHIHCSEVGQWNSTSFDKDIFTKVATVAFNPPEKVQNVPGSEHLLSCLKRVLNSQDLEEMMEASTLVGNIRFNRPTLYMFPAGQGDCALFGINGFNMLIDGGFNRKPCSWEFIRHLDRLDAVLVTRLCENNVCGMSTLMKRKSLNNTYPQIGYVFCNIPENKATSPKEESAKDNLIVSVVNEGHNFIQTLDDLKLKPHQCWRDLAAEPFVLYHKVGHGTLEMHVLSPPKDSKEMKEFISEWSSFKETFSSAKSGLKGNRIPLSHATSICAVLIWRPADPKDTITRILFPGSAPQNKIFESLERLKTLDVLNHPVVTKASLSVLTKTVINQKVEKSVSRASIPNRKITASPALSVASAASRNGDIGGLKTENKEVKKAVKEIVKKEVKKEVKKDPLKEKKEIKADVIKKEVAKKDFAPKEVKKEVKKIIKKENKDTKTTVEKKSEIKSTVKKETASVTKTVSEVKKTSSTTVKKTAPAKPKPISAAKPAEIRKSAPAKMSEPKTTKDLSTKKVSETKTASKPKPKSATSTPKTSAPKTKPVAVPKPGGKMTKAVAASSIVASAVAVTAAAFELNEKKEEIVIEPEAEIEAVKEPEVTSEVKAMDAIEKPEEEVVVSPLPPEALSPTPSESVSLTPSDTLSSAPLETVSPTPPLANEPISTEEKEVNEIKDIEQDMPYETDMTEEVAEVGNDEIKKELENGATEKDIDIISSGDLEEKEDEVRQQLEKEIDEISQGEVGKEVDEISEGELEKGLNEIIHDEVVKEVSEVNYGEPEKEIDDVGDEGLGKETFEVSQGEVEKEIDEVREEDLDKEIDEVSQDEVEKDEASQNELDKEIDEASQGEVEKVEEDFGHDDMENETNKFVNGELNKEINVCADGDFEQKSQNYYIEEGAEEVNKDNIDVEEVNEIEAQLARLQQNNDAMSTSFVESQEIENITAQPSQLESEAALTDTHGELISSEKQIEKEEGYIIESNETNVDDQLAQMSMEGSFCAGGSYEIEETNIETEENVTDQISQVTEYEETQKTNHMDEFEDHEKESSSVKYGDQQQDYDIMKKVETDMSEVEEKLLVKEETINYESENIHISNENDNADVNKIENEFEIRDNILAQEKEIAAEMSHTYGSHEQIKTFEQSLDEQYDQQPELQALKETISRASKEDFEISQNIIHDADMQESSVDEPEEILRKESDASVKINEEELENLNQMRRKSGTESEDDVDLQQYMSNKEKYFSEQDKSKQDDDLVDEVKSQNYQETVDYEHSMNELISDKEMASTTITQGEFDEKVYPSEKQYFDEKEHDSTEEQETDDGEMIRHPTPPETKYSEDEMRDPIGPHFITTPGMKQGTDITEQPLYEEVEDDMSDRSESPVVEQPVFGSAVEADFPELVTVSGGTTPSEPQSPKAGFDSKKFGAEAVVMEALSEHDLSESSTHSPSCHDSAKFELPTSTDVLSSEKQMLHASEVIEHQNQENQKIISDNEDEEINDESHIEKEQVGFSQSHEKSDIPSEDESYSQNEKSETRSEKSDDDDEKSNTRHDDKSDMHDDKSDNQFDGKSDVMDDEKRSDTHDDERRSDTHDDERRSDIHEDDRTDSHHDDKHDDYDENRDNQESEQLSYEASYDDDESQQGTSISNSAFYSEIVDEKLKNTSEFDISNKYSEFKIENNEHLLESNRFETDVSNLKSDEFGMLKNPAHDVDSNVTEESHLNNETKVSDTLHDSQHANDSNLFSENRISSTSEFFHSEMQQRETDTLFTSAEYKNEENTIESDVPKSTMKYEDEYDSHYYSENGLNKDKMFESSEKEIHSVYDESHEAPSKVYDSLPENTEIAQSHASSYSHFDEKSDYDYRYGNISSGHPEETEISSATSKELGFHLEEKHFSEETKTFSVSQNYEHNLETSHENIDDQIISSLHATEEQQLHGDAKYSIPPPDFSDFSTQKFETEYTERGAYEEDHFESTQGGNAEYYEKLNSSSGTHETSGNETHMTTDDALFQKVNGSEQMSWTQGAEYSEHYTSQTVSQLEGTGYSVPAASQLEGTGFSVSQQESSYIINSRFHSDSPEDNIMRSDSSPDVPYPPSSINPLQHGMEGENFIQTKEEYANINIPQADGIPISPNNTSKNANQDDPYGESSEDDDSSSVPGNVSPYAYTNKAYAKEEEDIDGNHIYKEATLEKNSEILKQVEFDGNNPHSLTTEQVGYSQNLTSEQVTYAQNYQETQYSGNTNYGDFRLEEWEKPMGLPTPPESTKTVSKKADKPPAKSLGKSVDTNGKAYSPSVATKLSSPLKKPKAKTTKESSSTPVYVDLAYVPHHGDPHYCDIEFFKKIRARYYVFSGINPSKEVLNALLDAKKSWKEDMEVTIIPTYETDTLGYWMAQNQDDLATYSIEVAPSASRCTVNLQDHETSCAAYRLEF